MSFFSRQQGGFSHAAAQTAVLYHISAGAYTALKSNLPMSISSTVNGFAVFHPPRV